MSFTMALICHYIPGSEPDRLFSETITNLKKFNPSKNTLVRNENPILQAKKPET